MLLEYRNGSRANNKKVRFHLLFWKCSFKIIIAVKLLHKCGEVSFSLFSDKCNKFDFISKMHTRPLEPKRKVEKLFWEQPVELQNPKKGEKLNNDQLSQY